MINKNILIIGAIMILVIVVYSLTAQEIVIDIELSGAGNATIPIPLNNTIQINEMHGKLKVKFPMVLLWMVQGVK